MVLDQVVSLLSKFWLDSLKSSISVSTDVEDFSSSWVIESDFSLKLSLKMSQQSVVKFVVLGELCLDLGAVVGSEEVLKVVELVGVGFVFESVDGGFVKNDSLLEEEKTSEHETIACSMEDVSLFGQVSELSACVHDEDNDFLFMDVTLSSLGNNSFLFSFTLRSIISMNILHVQLDVEWIHKLHFFSTIACFIFLEQLSNLVFGVSEHDGSK